MRRLNLDHDAVDAAIASPLPSFAETCDADAVALLSLDLTQPFVEAIGLDASEGTLLLDAARVLVEAHRERGDDQAHLPLEHVGERFVEEVRERGGDGAASRLGRWLDETFHRVYAERPHWNGWREGLAMCLENPVDALPLSEAKRRAATARFGAALDLEDLHLQIDALLPRAWSDWDLMMFLRRGENPYAPEGAPFFPHLHLAGFVRFRRELRAFWADLDAEEGERLRAHIEVVLRRAGAFVDTRLSSPPSIPRHRRPC